MVKIESFVQIDLRRLGNDSFGGSEKLNPYDAIVNALINKNELEISISNGFLENYIININPIRLPSAWSNTNRFLGVYSEDYPFTIISINRPVPEYLKESEIEYIQIIINRNILYLYLKLELL